jgi:hypothetical protein
LREGRDARGQERPREADDGVHCERREGDSLGVASAGWRENVGGELAGLLEVAIAIWTLGGESSLALNFWRF